MPRSSSVTLDAILTSAFRLFFRRGYARVSMEDIAREAGVTKRTLYNHFDSKDALVGAVLQSQVGLSLAEFQKWSDDRAETAETFLDGLLLQLAEWAQTPGWTGSGFTRLSLELSDLPGHPVREAARNHKRAVECWLADELQTRDVKEARVKAETFCVLLEGALVLALIHNDTKYIDRVRGAVRELFVD